MNFKLLQTETIVVTREDFSSGSYNTDGYFVKGTNSVLNILANVQPTRGADVLQLSESDRLREIWTIFSKDEIKLKDTVVRNTFKYEVLNVRDWSSYPMKAINFKSIMAKVEVQ